MKDVEMTTCKWSFEGRFFCDIGFGEIKIFFTTVLFISWIAISIFFHFQIGVNTFQLCDKNIYNCFFHKSYGKKMD